MRNVTLPRSMLPDNLPRGPNALARVCEEQIAKLEAQRSALPRSERKPINQHLHTVRQLLAWCKTRAGYVETPADLGLLDADEVPGEGG